MLTIWLGMLIRIPIENAVAALMKKYSPKPKLALLSNYIYICYQFTFFFARLVTLEPRFK